MLEVKSIAFSFHRKTVLQNLSFHAKNGEVLTILGANGTGKTTLCRGNSRGWYIYQKNIHAQYGKTYSLCAPIFFRRRRRRIFRHGFYSDGAKRAYGEHLYKGG